MKEDERYEKRGQRVDVHVHLPEEIQGGNRLARIEALLQTILNKENKIMATVDEVLSGISELPTINDSLDAVFAKLQELITAGGTDPAKLQEAITLLTTQKDRTKAAIVANTPAATDPNNPPAFRGGR